MKYKVVLIPSDQGYAVGCPGLPGCWSQGETEADALENIRSAIAEWLETRDQVLLAEYGAEPGISVREVEVDAAVLR